MDDAEFTDEFCAFVQTTIPSVAMAELLLLLKQQAGRWWHPGEFTVALPSEARIPPAEVDRCLELLRLRGLLATDAEQRVRYAPSSTDADGMVQLLARTYRERPVTLIRMIYALRDSSIRSFAEAFRFRKG
jgi:hypothetical protein